MKARKKKNHQNDYLLTDRVRPCQLYQFKIKVETKSKKPGVIKMAEDKLRVKVKAPATRGLANQEMKMLVANYLGIEKSQIRLIKGWRSTSKIIEILS